MSRLKWAPFTILLFFYPFFFPTVATSPTYPVAAHLPLQPRLRPSLCRRGSHGVRRFASTHAHPFATMSTLCRRPCVPMATPCRPQHLQPSPRLSARVLSRRSRTRAAATASSTRAAARHPVVAYSDVTCAKKRDEPCPLVFEGYRDILDFGKYS